MMTKNADKKREQMMMFSMDSMVPQDHMLRLIDKAINWNFIYDLVEDKYCQNNGRPSMDPVMLIKIPFIQYLYGIKSMRQTIREIEVNVAYRWFLGLDMLDPVPHFSTFGKNYSRRFKDTDLFEQIFSKILEECMKYKLINTDEIFVDATHVKACANSKKMRKRVAHEQALWYEDELQKEINEDRQAHGKKPLKDKNKKNPPTPPTSGNDQHNELEEIPDDIKTKKSSITDPESGWFRKGEHKHVFAYAVETACDEHGWVLGYSVHPGNEHDSRTFQTIYEKVKSFEPEMIVADAGYKTPAIARQLLKDRIEPLFPYKRPMTKEGFFKKYEYVYDEYYDCYICPENQILRYSTTNRDGYREYKSCGYQCEKCPQISKCTESKNHVKVITRHVWEKYIEKAEDIRHVRGNKAIYQKRKETIERIFGTAKEHHGFRYTQYIGKARMEMKAGLTFACMNLKKLARFLGKNGLLNGQKRRFLRNFWIQFNFKGKNGAGMIPAPSLSTVWTIFMLREEHTDKDYFIRMEPWYHQANTVSIKAGADAPYAALSMMLGEPMEYKEDAADDNVIFTRFEKSVCLNTREEPIVEIHDFKDLYHLDEGIGSVIFDLDDTLYSEKDYVRSSFRVVERMLPEVNNIFNKLCAALEKRQPPLETVLKDAGMYSDELLLKCREAIRDHKPEISLYEGVLSLIHI